jgi:hypothetical protein
MAFLLKFFLDHQCINQNLILKWYNSDQARQYEGFEEAKQLAKSFVESFDTGKNNILIHFLNSFILFSGSQASSS